MVSNAFVRVVNNTNNQAIAKYDLTEDMSMETAMIFNYIDTTVRKFKAPVKDLTGVYSHYVSTLVSMLGSTPNV